MTRRLTNSERIEKNRLLAEELERAQGAVYIIRAGDDGPVKIGYVHREEAVVARLNDLQHANHERLTLIRVIPGAMRQTEKWLHRQFSSNRIRGEWFFFDERMMTIGKPQLTIGELTEIERNVMEQMIRLTEGRRIGLALTGSLPDRYRRKEIPPLLKNLLTTGNNG